MDRIATFQPTDNMQYYLRSRESMMNEMTNKLGAQRRIRRLRDDPLAAGRATRFQSGVARMKTFQSNIERARGHLAFMEGGLRQSLDILQRINEIAVQGANGIYDRSQLGYMAGEVDQLLHELLIIVNGRSEEGDFLFSGFDRSTQSFRPRFGPVEGVSGERITVVDYIGDIGQNQVEVTDGALVPVDLPGNRAFWAENQQIYSTTPASGYRVQEDSVIRIDGVEISLTAGDNIFAIISKINASGAPVRARRDPVTAALVLETTVPHQIWPEDIGQGTVLQDLGIIGVGDQSPPMNLSDSARVFGGSIFDMVIHLRDRLYEGDIEEVGGSAKRGIQDAITSMAGVLAEVGSRDNRLRVTSEWLSYEIPEMMQLNSNEVDLDMAEAISDLSMLEFAHRTNLSATARILRTSLLDFLR